MQKVSFALPITSVELVKITVQFTRLKVINLARRLSPKKVIGSNLRLVTHFRDGHQFAVS